MKTSIIENLKAILQGDFVLIILLCGVLLTSMEYSNVYYIASFSVAAIFLMRTKNYTDNIFNALVIFSSVYVGILILNGNVLSWFNAFCYLISPAIFYIIGKHFTRKLQTESALVSFTLLVFLLFCFNLYIEIIHDVINIGIYNPLRTIGEDSEAGISSATVLGTMCVFGISSFAYFLYSISKGLNFNLILSLLLSSLSLLTTIHLLNRTGIYIIVIAIIFAFFYRGNLRNTKSAIIMVLVLLLLFMLIYNSNMVSDDLLDQYRLRNENDLDRSVAGGRGNQWVKSLGFLFSRPFGWDYKEIGYSHNFWLDTARNAGIIPFFLLIWLSTKVYKQFKLLYNRPHTMVNSLVLGMLICVTTQAFMEPLIDCSQLSYYLMCMLWGVLVELNNKSYDNFHES